MSPASVKEGATPGATLTGVVNDPDSGDVLEVTIAWGDGTLEALNTSSTAAGTTFTQTHTSRDDGPSSDLVTVTLTANDSGGGNGNANGNSADGGSASATRTITVTNVDPTVSALDVSSVKVKKSARLSGTITDPG